MKKKILPMKYPFITSNQYHANLLSILTNHEETDPWVLSNYIQLEMPQNLHWPRLDFYNPVSWKTCPWIYYQRISREYIRNKWSSFKEFIIESIDLGYYVYFVADHYFISASNEFQKSHFKHDIFIYGYNLEEDGIDISDFLINGKYTYSKTDLSMIENAFKGVSDDEDWLSGVELLSYRKNKNRNFRISPIRYRFDIQLVADSIREYLLSTPTAQRHNFSSEQYKRNYIFGIQVYDQLSKCLSLTYDKKIGADLRPFHVLWDHKVVMLRLIKFLVNNSYLLDGEYYIKEYTLVERETQVIRNLYMKFLIDSDFAILLKIREELLKVKELEIKILEGILHNIPKATELRDIRKKTYNLASTAIAHASSLNINNHESPQSAIDGDPDTFYASDRYPSFPQYYTLTWNEGKSFDSIIIKCFDVFLAGITDVEIEASDDGRSGWYVIASRKSIRYNSSTEILKINFDLVQNKKGVRLKINNANLNGSVIIINEIEILWANEE